MSISFKSSSKETTKSLFFGDVLQTLNRYSGMINFHGEGPGGDVVLDADGTKNILELIQSGPDLSALSTKEIPEEPSDTESQEWLDWNRQYGGFSKVPVSGSKVVVTTKIIVTCEELKE